ncbi:MAG: hypothetical protein ACRENG_22330 [bacterium]
MMQDVAGLDPETSGHFVAWGSGGTPADLIRWANARKDSAIALTQCVD